jgi:hypothetical protein
MSASDRGEVSGGRDGAAPQALQSCPCMGYAIGEIAVLRVDRIEGYGAYFKGQTDDPTSVLVLVPEIAWVPTPHPSLRLSLGEEREVLVQRQVSETEYTGSLRRLDEENPYQELLGMPAGTELRATLKLSLGGHGSCRSEGIVTSRRMHGARWVRRALGGRVCVCGSSGWTRRPGGRSASSSPKTDPVVPRRGV